MLIVPLPNEYVPPTGGVHVTLPPLIDVLSCPAVAPLRVNPKIARLTTCPAFALMIEPLTVNPV